MTNETTDHPDPTPGAPRPLDVARDEPWLDGDDLDLPEEWSGTWFEDEPGWDRFDDLGPDDDLPEHDDSPLTTPGEVLDLLLRLVGPERAGRTALWALGLDAELRPLPFVVPVSGVPARADARTAAALTSALRDVLVATAPGGSVALAIVRRAGGDRGVYESSWAAALRAAAEDVDLRVHAIVAIGETRARVLEW